MIRFKHGGSFVNTERFLERGKNADYRTTFNRYGSAGVDALEAATPVDSGITAGSWGFEVTRKGGRYTITWTNEHIHNGIPIAIIIQYGHGTGSGGYVEGRDYINPAIRPIFDDLAEKLYKEVTEL